MAQAIPAVLNACDAAPLFCTLVLSLRILVMDVATWSLTPKDDTKGASASGLSKSIAVAVVAHVAPTTIRRGKHRPTKLGITKLTMRILRARGTFWIVDVHSSTSGNYFWPSGELTVTVPWRDDVQVGCGCASTSEAVEGMRQEMGKGTGPSLFAGFRTRALPCGRVQTD
jgi:hypothetical protein